MPFITFLPISRIPKYESTSSMVLPNFLTFIFKSYKNGESGDHSFAFGISSFISLFATPLALATFLSPSYASTSICCKISSAFAVIER